ncbi:MAG TPA: GNAT family N-acetyltransferase [Sedimentibacter sp.]|nr:GNAT family N-acetyltransferase [Sedimentibacter sp.]HNZ82168.1 GNAT family N-acetyltransferase [Sedimentibacter sp.]HOH68936.1 GNAT family N-acetyltransferase [Sedimentibacter sp.]HPW99609.1 GNAT family N-acetyltransferase [Sedimentibacter sp.]
MEKLVLSGTVQLETKRFLLRKFQMSDAHDIYSNWLSDEDSARYNAWRVHSSIEVTKEYLSEWISLYKKNDYYHWAVADKVTDEVIGSVTVSNIKKRKKYCEIGYTIAKKLWNKGIATEVLICTLNYLTQEAGFERICALHDIRNEASGKVMKKAGMQFVKNKTQIYLNSNNIIMKCRLYEYKKSLL